MKSVYQMLPHHALSRAAVVNAGKLIEEFDGLLVNPLDTKILSEFSSSYKAFTKCMEDRFISEDTVITLYKKLTAQMSRVLMHYVDVSMMCRKYYDAFLDFSKDEQEYSRLLPRLHKCLSVEEYASLVTLCTDLRLSFQECCIPNEECLIDFRNRLLNFTQRLSTLSGDNTAPDKED